VIVSPILKEVKLIMAKGILRKIDELGRVTLPIEIRRATGIDVLVHTDLLIDNGVIRLQKGKGRGIDDLGRYTIPKEIRMRYGWETGQKMEIFEDCGFVYIKKVGCEWCDSTEDLFEIDGHRLCRKHAYRVVDTVMES
jgi:bifunctional DNA-binding transcriptional regulator/antitoxin component of YhaV-PrlF toxin-antitoxin module